MREAINFLMKVYDSSIPDIASILCAQADHDKDTILRYLGYIDRYVNGLINKVKDEDLSKCV